MKEYTKHERVYMYDIKDQAQQKYNSIQWLS